jgi:hypothetical protein
VKAELNYSLSGHAAMRASQRAVGDELLDFLMLYGEVREQKGGCYLLSIENHEKKRLQRALKKLQRTLDNPAPMTAVVGDDGRIVTLAREIRSARFEH